MIVISCQHETRHKHGKNKCGNQRYKCANCGATFVDESGPLGNMRLDMKQATMALSLMLEGMSDPQRSTPDRPLPSNAGRSNCAGR